MRTRVASIGLGCGITALSFAALPVSLLWAAAPDAASPVLVVAPPWGSDGSAAALVVADGGRIIGPTEAPFAVLAMVDDPERLIAAGAWAVLDGRQIAQWCGIAVSTSGNLQ